MSSSKANLQEILDRNMGGRKPKDILLNDQDFEILRKLCELQCTGDECASFFGVGYDLLNDRVKLRYAMSFPDYFKKFSGSGRVSLRRMQWRTAQRGNPIMQIWLGKQYLGQADKTEVDAPNSLAEKRYIYNITQNIIQNPEGRDLAGQLLRQAAGLLPAPVERLAEPEPEEKVIVVE